MTLFVPLLVSGLISSNIQPISMDVSYLIRLIPFYSLL